MKYGNHKTNYDGIFFDSKKEARRFAELKMLLKSGQITDLELQRSFELIPAQYEVVPRYNAKGKRLKDGKKCIEKSCVYKADFVYVNKNGEMVVEDTKSPVTRTKDYIIKRKLMLYKYGIKIVEI